MKFFITLVLILGVNIVLLGAPIAFSGENPELYQVKVKSREVANRIVESRIRGHLVLVDQPKKFGADDLAPTPPEYMAVAYSSCVLSTLRLVAMLDKLDINNIEVQVEGDIDFSKALGNATTNRAGFSGLKVKISFESSLSKNEQQLFIQKAMSRGAVLDNVLNKTPVSYEMIN